MLKEEEDDGRAHPRMRTPSEESEEERLIAEDGIRVYLRHFAGDPAALEVIHGWRKGSFARRGRPSRSSTGG